MKTFAADKTTVMIHKQIPTTGNAMGGSVLRPGPFLSLVFLSFEFVWDLLLRISDFKHAHRARMFGTKSEIRSTEKWEEGRKGGREEGKTEDAMACCW